LDRIERRKNQVGDRFREFLARAGTAAAAPFGQIDLRLAATAVKRPALAGSPAKPREPYGVAELFRQALDSADRFRARRRRSQRRLFVTVVGSLGLLGLLAAGGTTLYRSRTGVPSLLETQFDRWRARDQDLTPAERHRYLQARLDELTALVNDRAFAELPPEKEEQTRARLQELQAYQEYARQLAQIQDVRDARSLEQLGQIQAGLEQLEVPAAYRLEWSQTDAGRRHADALEDVAALRAAVTRVRDWYEKLNKEGQQVLNNAREANLPARAKKVLDQAAGPPFPEGEPDKVLPGGRRITYATVFRFPGVAEARLRWDEIRKKLEPYARLEGS
jgi:hypothetical protein